MVKEQELLKTTQKQEEEEEECYDRLHPAKHGIITKMAVFNIIYNINRFIHVGSINRWEDKMNLK